MVATNARDGGDPAASPENYGRIFRFQISRHTHLIIAAAMSDIADVQIEMIAPEKWRRGKALMRTENIARGCLALPLRHDPMLHPDFPTGAHIGPERDVAGGKNFRHACL